VRTIEPMWNKVSFTCNREAVNYLITACLLTFRVGRGGELELGGSPVIEPMSTKACHKPRDMEI
jgi:hypothetical protein